MQLREGFLICLVIQSHNYIPVPVRYSMQKRCSGLLDSIESSLDNVLPMNAQYVEDTEYAKDTLWDIRLIVGSLYSSTLGYLGEESNVNETLQRLRLEQQQAEIKAMKAQLRRPKYQLDSCETVVAVCRSEQIEVVSTISENLCVLFNCLTITISQCCP